MNYENPMQYYGFFGWKENEPNYRKYKLPNHPRAGTKESKYIHNLNIGSLIIDFIKSKQLDIDSGKIKSFEFQPYDDISNTDILQVQKMINLSYDINESEPYPYDIPWMKLNILHRSSNRGYNHEFAENMLNLYAEKSKDILNNTILLNSLSNNHIEQLKLQEQRTCLNISNVPTINSINNNNKIYLQDIIIPNNDKQLLLGSMQILNEYSGNNKLLIKPFIDKENLGSLSWDLLLNIISINCINKNSNSLFPVHFILDKNPNIIFHINLFDIINDNKYIFVGFFIIRYEFDSSINSFIDPNCPELYDFKFNKPHNSIKPYYIMFVFKHNHFIIVNFRTNLIKWGGNYTDTHRVLYNEIKQIMCSYLNDECELYLLSEESINIDEKNIYEKCNIIHEKEINKKSNENCVEAWYDEETYELLQNEYIKLSIDNKIHILTSKKKTLKELYYELKKNSLITKIKLCNQYNIQKLLFNVFNKTYVIIKCHFKFDNKPDKFISYIPLYCITYNSMTNLDKEEYKKMTCLYNNCTFMRDKMKALKVKSLYNKDLSIINPEELTLENYLKQKGGKNKVNLFEKIQFYGKKILDILSYQCKKDIIFNYELDKLFNKNSCTQISELFRDYANDYVKLLNNNEIIYNVSSLINLDTILITGEFILYVNNNILIITHNINFADMILLYYKNYNITLIVTSCINIKSFIKLKNNKKHIKIYFIGTIIFNSTIDLILKTNKFDTIIVDNGRNSYFNYQYKLNSLSLYLCQKYLNTGGSLIKYLRIPYNNDSNFKVLEKEFKLFKYHKYNTSTMHRYGIFIYINYNPLSKNKKSFTKFILKYWKILYTLLKKPKKQIGGYHNINNTSYIEYFNKPPEEVDELKNSSQYINEFKDYPPLCHWGQKKLLLSEIQLFTKICKTLNIKKLSDYIVVYIGAADGTHLPILFKMFPELSWLLYDPNKFNNNVKGDNVKKFNQFFLDETVEHVKKNNINNKKIILISDIRVEPTEEQIMSDMINQANWGMEMNAIFMYLKFRLPYDLENNFIPKSLNDLKFNKKYINNPDLISDNTLYLDGILYLQLYPPPYSTELRLFVKQDNNGKYNLKSYNHVDIENKLFFYNSKVRGTAKVEEYEFLNCIPGYTNNIENVMDYEIFKQYYKYFNNLNDDEILKKFYDMNIYFEKITYKTLIKCNITKIKPNEDIRRTIWREIMKVEVNNSIILQIDFLKKNANKYLDKIRIDNAIKYIQPKLTKELYFELLPTENI